MKKITLILLIFISISVSSQNKCIWQGGTPGRETMWEEAKNWSGQNLPDEYSLVIIKQINSGHNAQPVINKDVTIAGIEIHTGATLTILNNATLSIDGKYTYSEGLVSYGGEIINNGVLLQINIEPIVGRNNTAESFINTEYEYDGN